MLATKHIPKIGAASAVLIATLLLVSASLASVSTTLPAAPTAVSSAGIGDPPVSDVCISIILPPGVDPLDPVVSIDELVLFMAEAVGGAGSLSYTWDFGDGTIIEDGSLIDHTYIESGVYTVEVIVNDTVIIDGVPTVVGTASDSITLTVEGGDPTPGDMVNDLIALVEATDDNPDWRRARQKDAMLNKLSDLNDLIANEDYADAYRKLLQDIKPKLTGLRTIGDQEIPWPCAWLINPDLQTDSLAIINDLLPMLLDLGSDDTAETLVANLIAAVSKSSSADWKLPLLKDRMLDKLDRLSDLIANLKFTLACWKLHLDIKPKLTGLITIGGEELPWWLSWVSNSDLKTACNGIISDLLIQLVSLGATPPFWT